jgi:hypothetical protein
MTKKTLSLILSLLLTVSIAVTILSGCNDQKDPAPSSTAENSLTWTIGEGAKSFSFSSTDADGIVTNWTVRTDAENVGAALVEVSLISGDTTEFGLMVKTVNGLTADFDADGAYWAFYIEDEFATTGVDTTPIEESKAYSFVYTKS